MISKIVGDTARMLDCELSCVCSENVWQSKIRRRIARKSEVDSKLVAYQVKSLHDYDAIPLSLLKGVAVKWII